MRVEWRTVVISAVTGAFLVAAGVQAHEWAAPEEAGKRVNPIRFSDSSVQRGQAIYMEDCISCHGENLEGRGKEELGLDKDAPNLKRSTRTHKDGDIFWKIQNGRGDMPAFKNDLTEEQIWDTVNFIRASAEE